MDATPKTNEAADETDAVSTEDVAQQLVSMRSSVLSRHVPMVLTNAVGDGRELPIIQVQRELGSGGDSEQHSLTRSSCPCCQCTSCNCYDTSSSLPTPPPSAGAHRSDLTFDTRCNPIPSFPPDSTMAVAPKPNDCGGPVLPSENTEQSSNQPNNSWIFHPNLIRKKLVVTAHGGGYLNKKLVVHAIQQEDGRTEIVWDHYNKQHIISPQWVYPRHPNHARDNGLLVVIAGEHTGKYVRRFNHAVSGSLFVEAVDHSEGKMDQLTGEELCVTAQEVCIAFESSGDRELNRNVMKQKRDRYYKTHRR